MHGFRSREPPRQFFRKSCLDTPLNSDYEALEVLQQIRFDRLKILKERLNNEFEENKKHQLQDYRVKLVGNSSGWTGRKMIIGSTGKGSQRFSERSRMQKPTERVFWRTCDFSKSCKKGPIDFVKLNKMAVAKGRKQYDKR